MPVRRSLRRFRPIACLAAAAPLMLVGTAMAQLEDAPPSADIRTGFPVWLSYLVIFVLIVAVLSIGLYPAKRSHQD